MLRSVSNNANAQRLLTLFQAPEFADSEKNRVAALLNTIVWGLLALAGTYLFIAPLILADPRTNLLGTGLTIVVYVITLVMLHRGAVAQAAILLCTMLWLLVTFVAFAYGGALTPAYISYFTCVLIVGLLLGGRRAALVTVLSLAASALLLIGEQRGWLPAPLLPNSPVAMWSITGVNLVAVVLLLSLALRNTAIVLDRLRQNEAALAQGIAALESRTESLHASLDEVAHGHRLLLGLSELAQRVQQVRSRDEMYRRVGDEIRRLAFHAVFFAADEDAQQFTFRHATFDEAAFRHAETLLGRPAAAFRFTLRPGSTYDRLVHERQTVFATVTDAYMDEVGIPSIVAQPLVQFLGIQQTIGAPIVVEDRLEGLMFVIGRNLREIDVPAVTVLATQIGSTLRTIKLYDAVRAQAVRLQQILDAVPTGIVLLDADQRVLLANPSGRADLALLSGVQEGDTVRHVADRSLRTLLHANGAHAWHELKLGDPERTYEFSVRPVENGQTGLGWILVLRDVTEARAQQEYQRAQARLATVGQLAAGIAHDFNNIMAVISLYAELVLHTEQPAAANARRLETILQQTQRARTLIDQVLDFSRRSVMERLPIDITAQLHEIVSLVRRTLPENIHIELDGDPPSYIVRADPGRIQQVLMNLSLNARDAMPGGGTLSFSMAALDVTHGESSPLPNMTPGGWLALSVSDTGDGIAPDLLPHVFEPFFTTKPPGQGTGLGLSQAYGIVKQHDGHVHIDSLAGHGTRVTLFLPLVGATDPAEMPVAGVDATLPEGHGETILVVEDNRDTRLAVRAALEAIGYRVLEAIDGQDALERLAQRAADVDLVLSDLVMPRLDGQALLRALQQRAAERGVPPPRMVIMTGYPIDTEGKALLEQGVIEWVSKPFTTATVATAIQRALQAEPIA